MAADALFLSLDEESPSFMKGETLVAPPSSIPCTQSEYVKMRKRSCVYLYNTPAHIVSPPNTCT